MSYVFELIFDPVTERAIRHIWQAISDAGYFSAQDADGYRPHISLAVYETDDFPIEACHRRAKMLARQLAAFPVNFSHIGIFFQPAHILFLGVTPSQALLQRHRDILELCQAHQQELRPYYQPDLWTPHVTLSFNLNARLMLEILETGVMQRHPATGRVQALHLVQVAPDHARDLFTCEFSG